MTAAETQETLSSNLRWLGLYCKSGFRECFRFHRPEHLKDRPIDYCSFLQVFLAKLLLEVCGAAGAIWGSSEFLGLRTLGNWNVWRPICYAVFGIFSIRFWWHIKHFAEHAREFPPIKLKHRRLHKLSFSQIFSAKLVLEVLGGAGAIWGPSDALTFRVADNNEAWRIASIIFLGFFTIRWVFQIFTYCLCFHKYMEQRPTLNQCLGWCEVLLVRFVLVCLGAIGAVWGFSEILGFRTAETNYFWRPISLAVGVAFFFRWIFQVIEYGLGGWEDDAKWLKAHEHSSRRLRLTSQRLSTQIKLKCSDEDDEQLNDLELTETPVMTPPEDDNA